MAHYELLCSTLTCAAVALASFPAVASPSFGVAGLVFAPEQEDPNAGAREAYNEGEKAYRLGKFDDAAVAFERAYELSGLPDILYNIGLSHLRWYDVDPDIAHLRKAKVVFQNYVIEIQKNPELGDLAEAEAVIAKIDEKMAAAEAAANDDDDDEPVVVDHGPDPGKKLRLGGSIAMGVGGAFIVGGVVSGVVLGVRSQEFEEKLANDYIERNELGCAATDTEPACVDVNARIDANRRNGQLANTLAVALGLSFGGIGVIGVVAGAVLFVQGNKRTKAWEAKQVSLVPSIGADHAGLVLSGRF